MDSEHIKQTVLVVDHDPDGIQVIKRILAASYLVLPVHDGSQVVAAASRDVTPDLILINVAMPGMDGFEICKALKETPRTTHVPVVFLADRGSVNDEMLGFTVGAVDYIRKPVSAQILRSRVRAHLVEHEWSLRLEREVRSRSREIHESHLEIIRALGRAAVFKENENPNHTLRVGLIAELLASHAGMDEADVELVVHAATLHDLGKLGIPSQILNKPTRLDANEWRIMKEHTLIGAEIIGRYKSPVIEMASTICLTHHEKWNGTGYPRGLSGEQIPMVGRVTAVADVFDMLTTHRPYRKALSIDESVAMIEKGGGQHFDPQLVPVFLAALPKVVDIKNRLRDQTVPRRHAAS